MSATFRVEGMGHAHSAESIDYKPYHVIFEFNTEKRGHVTPAQAFTEEVPESEWLDIISAKASSSQTEGCTCVTVRFPTYCAEFDMDTEEWLTAVDAVKASLEIYG